MKTDYGGNLSSTTPPFPGGSSTINVWTTPIITIDIDNSESTGSDTTNITN